MSSLYRICRMSAFVADSRISGMVADFVVFHLRLRPFAMWTTGTHQACPRLSFQLDEDIGDIRTSGGSHDDSAADLVKIRVGDVAGLVQNH